MISNSINLINIVKLKLVIYQNVFNTLIQNLRNVDYLAKLAHHKLNNFNVI